MESQANDQRGVGHAGYHPRAVDQLDRKNDELTVNFDAFNAAKVDRDGGDRILMDILRGGGFSASQFERAVDHWDKLPADLEEHSANGRTLWWLFNACTHGLKPTGRNSNHNDKAHQSAIIYNKLVAGGCGPPALAKLASGAFLTGPPGSILAGLFFAQTWRDF